MQSEYRVKGIYTEEDGGVVAKCYDILYGEDFEKYLGFPDDFDGKENASNLLQDSTYAMSDELRAEIEELFNIAEFNDEQDYDSYQFFDFDDDFDDEDDDEDEMNQKALAIMGKRESFNLREALNQIDLNTDNKYDLLNLYESCDLKENEKRALANIVYDQEDPSVIYDTLNNRYVSGEEIGMPERVKDGVIHESSVVDDYTVDKEDDLGDDELGDDELNAFYKGYTEEDKDENSPYNKLKKNVTESNSIKESDEETPYTKEEVERDLKSITHNFTDKEGELKCGFEEEKNFGVDILKQHYKVVEASGDDRRDGTWYHISFAEPLNKNESVDPSLLDDCPECGDKSFDTKKGKCTKCNYRESLKEYYSDDEEDDYEDSSLSPKQIIKLLKSHGVLHHMDGDKIMALESYEKLDDGTYKDNYVDVTNYTVHQLRDFLGY